MQSSHRDSVKYPPIASNGNDAYAPSSDLQRPFAFWGEANQNSHPAIHTNNFGYGPYPPSAYCPPQSDLPPLFAPVHSITHAPPAMLHSSAFAYPQIEPLCSNPSINQIPVTPPLPPPPLQQFVASNHWEYPGYFSDFSISLDTSSDGAVVPSLYQGELQSAGRSLRFHLLYGTLHVHIISAANLPNMDGFSETLRQALSVFDTQQRPLPFVQDSIAQITRRTITSDPYVCVVLKGATVAKTRVISNNQHPVWDEHFSIPVAHKVAEVKLVVKDNDMVGAQYIGEVRIPAEVLLNQKISDQFFDLVMRDGRPCRPGAQLRMSMEYCSVDDDSLYKDGVGAGPVYRGVPKTYFPLRVGCRVTLYQDAHVQGHSVPSIKLENSKNYGHRSCWEDICEAILDAHHLIYIAGWSVYTKIKLVRDRQSGWRKEEEAYKELGELLKAKARVARVLLLVWDDKTSHSFIHEDGVMGTHDEETKKYFKHTQVRCLLAPRYADSKLSWVKQQVVGTLYTHHQKLVIVDASVSGTSRSRQLVAFIGGLDLCDGRYDTPDHNLFRGFNTIFKDDYHNPTFPTKIDSGGPREPWHDLHCKIEGPAVYDVLENFEQRWRKTSRWHRLNLKWLGPHALKDDSLLKLEEEPLIVSPHKADFYRHNLHVTSEFDPETWHVQIFRSIDSGSVKGFPKCAQAVTDANLVGRKNVAVDMSIHTAYIKAIRSAQHFIYIENQYFLGSSFAWPSYKNAGANHLVPIELALKIVSKIKAGKQFAVYVVIPMWPEGNPESLAVQEILFFQGQTMEMMYSLIADALKEQKLENEYHPTDFLQFFCLGNREARGENEPVQRVPPVANSAQEKAFRSRRFMIYVHSKGMIVDDEFVIIGSANINQRSMDGSRDTEIAMGAYQPYHTWARKGRLPQGQVHGYRMSLWTEHFGVNEECFLEPWSLKCIKKVKDLAAGFWKQYTADEVTEMKGHILPYPVLVEKTGKVSPLPGFESFPDVGGKILGCSTTLPDNLTT